MCHPLALSVGELKHTILGPGPGKKKMSVTFFALDGLGEFTSNRDCFHLSEKGGWGRETKLGDLIKLNLFK